MNFVSAGVYMRDFDFSDYASLASQTTCACLGTATKGPVGKPVLVTSEPDLIRKFGKPDPNAPDYGLLSALMYLKQGRSLQYLRVANNAQTAGEDIDDGAVTPANVFRIAAASPGAWGDKVRVTLSESLSNNRFDISVSAIADNSNDNYTQVELFEGLSMDPSDKYYAEKAINEGVKGAFRASEYITLSMINAALYPRYATFQLDGGENGYTGLSAANYIGTYSGQMATGLKSFWNPEQVNVNVIITPGITDPSVIGETHALCASRNDCVAINDTPFGLDPDGVVAWHNGDGYSHGAFDTFYAAMYWSWAKVNDPYNDRNVWIPPSGLAAAQYAYTDSVAYPWFAVAGARRGKTTPVIELEMSPDQGQRDLLQGGMNAVNPLVSFVDGPTMIYGQKTLLRRRSSLDRVNVARLLMFSHKTVASTVRSLVFEQNDAQTRAEFIDLVEPIFRSVKAHRGLYEYSIVCNDDINPAALVDNYILNGKIFLQPTKVAEKLVVDFVLTETGASFSEA